MNFYIKNNNIFYEDYKILDGSLSLIIIPIAIVLILKKYLIEYFSYMFLCVAIIGSIDVYYRYVIYKYFWLFSMGGLLHLLLLYPLINIKKYMKPNKINFLLVLLGIIIITFLPYWPYELKKTNMIMLTVLIYIFSIFLYKFCS
tara:strand:- start:672 stop:1103 length:432 start_codon:yes stop_codon:yes gene_type:complete